MKLIITIDTEEDKVWGSYPPSDYTVRNIEKVPALQELFDNFGVKPTYLLSYPMATEETSMAVLKPILEEKKCEIGNHCHPWNTPPLEEENTVPNSMLCNLPPRLQHQKLRTLHLAIKENFGVEPLSFRAGRWGYGPEAARCLSELGYKVDSSITPYMDWSRHHGPDFSDVAPDPYRFSCERILNASQDGPLYEIPVTIGFRQANFRRCQRVLRLLRKKPLHRLRLDAILSRLRLIKKVWLSPETSDAASMIELTKRMADNNYTVVNMFFHSSSLLRGNSPFVKTASDEQAFIDRIRTYLQYARAEGMQPMTLSEATGFVF